MGKRRSSELYVDEAAMNERVRAMLDAGFGDLLAAVALIGVGIMFFAMRSVVFGTTFLVWGFCAYMIYVYIAKSRRSVKT